MDVRRLLIHLQLLVLMVAGVRMVAEGDPWAPATLLPVGALIVVGALALALLCQGDREADAVVEGRRLKTELLANVSHELRTPLNAILGYAEILDSMPDVTERERRQMISRILCNAVSLTCAVNNLLEYSSVVAGQSDLRRARVKLSELFEEIEPLVTSMIDEKPIAFEWAVDPEVPVLETDRGKLRQVLLNLLANAAKFTPAGAIHLSARPDTGAGSRGIEIAVADTGIGMSVRDQLGIFEDFRQVSGELARPFAGMGLGLALVQRFTTMLGGSIAVESRPSAGTSVKVRLPETPSTQAVAVSWLQA